MNQRLAAGLLTALSVLFIAAEFVVAAFGGFDPAWMVLLLSLYAGLVGVLFGLRNLSEGRRDVVESVSERRARARRGGLVGNLLDDYEIDDEFLGRGHRGGKPAASRPTATQAERIPDDEELKSAIAAYAGMAGGIVTLRETIEAMDDSAFASMARKAGMAGVTRERALAVVVGMVSAEGAPKSDEAPALSLSIDKESFDDYIKRCMSEADAQSGENETGNFSVGLDSEELSAMPSTPPTDFVHNPRAVMSRLNRPEGKHDDEA